MILGSLGPAPDDSVKEVSRMLVHRPYGSSSGRLGAGWLTVLKCPDGPPFLMITIVSACNLAASSSDGGTAPL